MQRSFWIERVEAPAACVAIWSSLEIKQILTTYSCELTTPIPMDTKEYLFTSVPRSDLPLLVPILRQSEESDKVLLQTIANLTGDDVLWVLRSKEDGTVVAAASMDWNAAKHGKTDGSDCELVHLAVDEAHQRKGLGKIMVESLVAEACRRRKEKFYVGTADSATGNIRFYLRRGFRMDHIEKDFFPMRYGWKVGEEVLEDGIPMRDAIYFSMDLTKMDLAS